MTLASDTPIPLGRKKMNKVSVVLAASAAALAIATAGCGGSSGGSSGSNAGSSSSSGSNANPNLEQAVKYAQCMRKNGVTNFPDPEKNGKFVIGAGGPNQNSPQFKSAKQACKSQEPPGIEDSPAEVAKAQQEWLAWARCMRKNGITNMPDPQDGRLLVPRDRIDINSPQFKRAMNTCRAVGGGAGNGKG
jgi:hypothetical protein